VFHQNAPIRVAIVYPLTEKNTAARRVPTQKLRILLASAGTQRAALKRLRLNETVGYSGAHARCSILCSTVALSFVPQPV